MLDAMITLKELFKEADTDGSGRLDRNEIAEMLQKYYRKYDRTSRKLERVQDEVNEAMKKYVPVLLVCTFSRRPSNCVFVGMMWTAQAT